jgi:hypothetical protein
LFLSPFLFSISLRVNPLTTAAKTKCVFNGILGKSQGENVRLTFHL